MPENETFHRELVLASGNAGKLKELSAMLQTLGWEVRLQSDWSIDEAVEDGLSFIENALIKARHSSRYAGDDADDSANINKLLRSMQGVELPDRTAHFYCAMALVRHAEDPVPLIASGKWSGSILDKPRGRGGFGYDPLFWVPGRECTSAELPPDVKNGLSHRGQALAALAGQMKNEFGG